MAKIKKIEFLGINGVGKSHNEVILRNILNLRKINTLNRREAIIFYSHKIIGLNILDKITLKYFKFIEKIKNKNKNKKISKKKIIYSEKNETKKNFRLLNLFRRRYYSICKKIYIDYCKKNYSIKKIVNKIISIQNKKNRALFSNWIYEMFAANYIIDKVKTNLKNEIYLCDEGFLQRSFLIMYSNIEYKEKKKILKSYIKFVPKPDLCIHLFREKNVIEAINQKRKLNKDGVWIEKNNLKKFNNFESQIIKYSQNEVSFLEIKNNEISKNKNIKKII